MQKFSTKIESNPEFPTDRCPDSKELRDTFYSNSKKGNIYHVILDQNGLLLTRDSSTDEYKKDLLVNISDIIGGRCVWIQKSSGIGAVGACGACTPSITEKKKSQIEETEDAYLYVFAYVLKKNMRKAPRRERTVITLRFRSYDNQEDNMREAEKWYKALKSHRANQIIHSNIYTADTSQNTQETVVLNRLLILLNPISGSGKAREIFNQHVITILNEAELPYDLYVTKHSNYAFNFVRQKKLSTWSGIVAIGGDGLFHEILNGLLKRKDWDLVTKSIALGVVPCGSGNGLARSIAYYFKEPYEPKPILGATLTVVGGKSSLMDVVEIEQRNNIMYSFLSVGWGLISDIDIESERLRSLGYQRFTIWTLHRLINLRTYRGKISYLRKANTDQQYTAETSNKTNSQYNTNSNTYPKKQEASCKYSSDFEDVISLETVANQSYRSRCNSLLSSSSKVSAYYSIAESIYHSVAGNSDCFEADMYNSENSEFSQGTRFGELHDNPLPSLQDPLPDTWTVEDGEFVMIHAVNQTHLGSDCFFSPDSKLNDGIIYLVIIRGGISRSQLFTFLINMSSGTHLPPKSTEFITVERVVAFRLEPHENKGILTVDGERIENGSIQARIFPGAVKVMVPNNGLVKDS